MTWSLLLVLAAILIDAAVGYPYAIYRLIGHPVTWMGRVISWLDTLFNSPKAPDPARRLMGVLAAVLNVGIAAAAGLGLSELLRGQPWWLALPILAILASSLVAIRSLYDHVAAVRDALRKRGLVAGRQAVGQIVGRNVDSLDQAGVCRAAIESLAESLCDGVVAPLFWMGLLGLPGAAAYKAINTADSMIGHRSERYLAFGWASARLDDLANFLPARLSGYLIVLSAAAVAKASPRKALEVMHRDARKHKSPNAGWPEAAMAGALGLRLNGPKSYGEEQIDDVWLGSGRPIATPDDIHRALQVYAHAVLLLWIFTALIALLLLMATR